MGIGVKYIAKLICRCGKTADVTPYAELEEPEIDAPISKLNYIKPPGWTWQWCHECEARNKALWSDCSPGEAVDYVRSGRYVRFSWGDAHGTKRLDDVVELIKRFPHQGQWQVMDIKA